MFMFTLSRENSRARLRKENKRKYNRVIIAISFLVQRLAVAIQRGNASAVLGSLRVWDKHEWFDW